MTAMTGSKSETDEMDASQSRHPTEWTLHAHALGLLDWAVAESVDHPDYEITRELAAGQPVVRTYPPWIE